MYNRYIPQPDGTFLRSRMAEPEATSSEAAVVPEEAPPKPTSEPKPEAKAQFRQQRIPSNSRNRRSEPRKERSPEGVGNFLRQLLPQNFDTEDLIVVLLLLLMSGDSNDDQNTALLTLVIYLFL